MTQTYKERAEALQISAPTNWPMGAQSDYHTGGWRVRAAAAELCAEADASLASKDAEIAQMYAAAGEAQAERDAARDERDALAAEVARLRWLLQEMADEFVRVYPIYYYAEPWAHNRNAVLQTVRMHLSARKKG